MDRVSSGRKLGLDYPNTQAHESSFVLGIRTGVMLPHRISMRVDDPKLVPVSGHASSCA